MTITAERTTSLKGATTTLKAIRAHSPCENGWQKLLNHLGKTKADAEPLSILTIIESNGIDDALWCLRALPDEYHPAIRLLACDYAERVLPIFERERPDDDRPRRAIETARRHALGNATDEELYAARAAAWDAARAARATRPAARAAADAAAFAADAADAARAAAMAAARAAALAAARDAEQQAQADTLRAALTA